MPSLYLTPDQYATFGLEDDTTEANVLQASAIVDQVLGRPEGLVWMPDYRGAPAYMAALTAPIAFQLVSGIQPGTDVVATVTPPIATQDLVGEVLILDRGEAATTEAVVVTAVGADRATITLGSVALTHAAKTLLELGLTIGEERNVASHRQIARVSKTPVLSLLSLQGRYGYGRRSDQVSGRFQDENLLVMVQTFGGAPPWVSINPVDAAISPKTGELFIPAGMLLSSYSEVRVRYVAGFPAGAIPEPIKMATAVCVAGLAAMADNPGAVKVYKTATTSVTRFTASSLDEDTRRMIKPFQAIKFF